MHTSSRFIGAALLVLASTARVAAGDLNDARDIDLDGVRGIGPALSTRILEERGKAKFSNWADLQTRVRGVGKAQARQLSGAGWTLGGTGYPTPETQRSTDPAPVRP